MNIFDSLNTSITTYVTTFTILVGLTYYFINRSTSNFKHSFKIGYSEVWSKYETSIILIIFATSALLGLYLNITIKSIFKVEQMRMFAGICLFFLMSISLIMQYYLDNRKRAIKNLGAEKSRLQKICIKFSNLIILILVIICALLSSFPIFILIEDKMIIISMFASIYFINLSFSIFGCFYNFINISKLTKRIIVLDDGEKMECFIIGIEDNFLIIRNGLGIEYLNTSSVKRIYEKIN